MLHVTAKLIYENLELFCIFIFARVWKISCLATLHVRTELKTKEMLLGKNMLELETGLTFLFYFWASERSYFRYAFRQSRRIASRISRNLVCARYSYLYVLSV